MSGGAAGTAAGQGGGGSSGTSGGGVGGKQGTAGAGMAGRRPSSGGSGGDPSGSNNMPAGGSAGKVAQAGTGGSSGLGEAGGPGVPVEGGLALYPSFDRDLIMWPGKAFEEAEVPVSPDKAVTATTTQQLVDAQAGSNVTITVPGGTNLGSVSWDGCGNDVEVIIEASASIKSLNITCGQRVRFRGPGTIGTVWLTGDQSSTPVTDFIFDGVVFNPGKLDANDSVLTTFQINRLAVLNCVGLAHTGPTPVFMISEGTQNFLVANSNLAVTGEGGGNKWVVRLQQDRGPDLKQVLFIDTTMQTVNQGFRFSSGNNKLISDVMLYRSTLVNVNQPDNVLHSQDEPPVSTDRIYARECTTVMSDSGSSGSSLGNFGGVPSLASYGGTDKLFHVVDNTYRARAESIVAASNLQRIMSSGAKEGWDLQYLGTAADPSSTTGAKFEYDPAIGDHWKMDGTGDWPEIKSPLVGLSTVIGKSPYSL